MQQLLVPGDPPPFSVHNEQGKAPLLLLCDHASKAVPEALGNLGISQAELSRHIGWDVGGLDAAIALAEALDAPLIASGYSRLVIDCNRWPGGEGSTPEISDGTPVPANKGLTKEQVDARAEACFWPYHREVDRHLDRMTAGGAKVALLVMHSFTPQMNGFKRPWHVGVLWNDDARLPEPLLVELRRGRHSRGVKQAGFWVLWRTSMPAVLVETGYLSNPSEEKDLNDDVQQSYIASAIFRAIRDYKQDMESSN
jgi:predicted N-formylglutamate amidohydrolase